MKVKLLTVLCLLLAILSADKTAALDSPPERWPYRIVVVPDTQRYTVDRIYESDPRKIGDTREKLSLAERNKVFEQMMAWVAENAAEQNIQLLLHVGDLVENKKNRAQYAMIEKGVSKLDGKVPYVLAIGNHDDATLASEFFPIKRNPLNVKMLGATRVEDNIGDRYTQITINGQKYLILTLNWHGLGRNTDPKSPRLQWANEIVQKHPDHRVIFLTHSLLVDAGKQGDKPSFGGTGQLLFDHLLKKHANICMTFCGHVYDRSGDGIATGYRKDLGVANNAIHSTLFNSQWIDTNGGDGWLRIVEFHQDGKVVHKSYSPYLDEWNKGADFEFVIAAEDEN